MNERRSKIVVPNIPAIRAGLEQNMPPGMRLSNGALGIALDALSAGVRPMLVGKTVAQATELFVRNGRRGKVGAFGPGRTVFEDLKDQTLLTKAQSSW